MTMYRLVNNRRAKLRHILYYGSSDGMSDVTLCGKTLQEEYQSILFPERLRADARLCDRCLGAYVISRKMEINSSNSELTK